MEHDQATDDELIARARAGDLDAFSTLTLRYQDVAYRVALSVTRQATDAEDASQEGFIRAFRALERFRLGAPFRPWLLKIVLNEARGRRRARLRSQQIDQRLVGSEVRVEADPMDLVLDMERADEVAVALRSLEPHHRQAIWCRYFLHLSEEETAEVLGCPVGTVKSRHSRALDRLRVIMNASAGAVRE